MENFLKPSIGQKVLENIKPETKEYRNGLTEDLKKVEDVGLDVSQELLENETLFRKTFLININSSKSEIEISNFISNLNENQIGIAKSILLEALDRLKDQLENNKTKRSYVKFSAVLSILDSLEQGNSFFEEPQNTFVTYRDNDLYANYIPQVIDQLKNQGRIVSIKVFPKDTSEEDIEDFVSQLEYNSNDQMLMDNTVGRNVPYDANISTVDLDKMFRFVTSKELNIESGANLVSTLKGIRNLFEFMFKENKLPESIYIINKYISHHGFYAIESKISDLISRSKEEGLGLEGDALFSYEDVYKRAGFSFQEYKNLTEDRDSEDLYDFISQAIKSELASYIPEKDIHIVDDNAEIPGDESTFVIYDRHVQKDIPNKFQIPLPFSSSVNYLNEKGIVDFDSDSFEKNLLKQTKCLDIDLAIAKGVKIEKDKLENKIE